MSDLEELRQAIVKFTQERDWDQFHNGKDLALALSIEAAELNEAFLWKDASEVDIEKVKEELADIVIRLLDFANEKYGDSMDWDRHFGEVPVLTEPFPVNAWNLVKYKLFSTQSELLDSIYFVYGMANQLDIDLDQHIVWKMRYNECREYKHGGKAY